MKKAVIIGVASLAAIGLLAGFADRMEHRDPKGAHDFMSQRIDQLLNDIKATDAQRAQINPLKEQLIQQGTALRQSQMDLHKELMAEWQNSQVDAAKIHAMVDQRVEAFRALAQKAADAVIQLHDVLTPEQRAQLGKELQTHHHHHEGH